MDIVTIFAQTFYFFHRVFSLYISFIIKKPLQSECLDLKNPTAFLGGVGFQINSTLQSVAVKALVYTIYCTRM